MGMEGAGALRYVLCSTELSNRERPKIELTFRGSRLGRLRFSASDFQGIFVKSNFVGSVRAASPCLNKMLRV